VAKRRMPSFFCPACNATGGKKAAVLCPLEWSVGPGPAPTRYPRRGQIEGEQWFEGLCARCGYRELHWQSTLCDMARRELAKWQTFEDARKERLRGHDIGDG